MGDEVVLSSNPRVLPVPAFFLSSSFLRSLQNGFSVVCTKLKNGRGWNTRPNQSRLWYYAVTVQWVALLLRKIRWQMVCEVFGCHCSNLKLGCWCVYVCVFFKTSVKMERQVAIGKIVGWRVHHFGVFWIWVRSVWHHLIAEWNPL